MTEIDFTDLVKSVLSNGQVANASKTPRHLATITKIAVSRGIAHGVDWRSAANEMNDWPDFSDAWEALRDASIFSVQHRDEEL